MGHLALEDEQRFDSLAFLEAEPGRGREPRPATSAFFQNRDCPYFPCHEGISTHDFNCLFCYCPLYTLGPNCKGNFTYTDAGRKNCTACTLPHQGENGARLVAAHYEQLAALARRQAD
jgi:Zn-finger protein